MEDGGEEGVVVVEVDTDGECMEQEEEEVELEDEVEGVHDRIEQLGRESMAQLDPQIF